MTKRICPVCDQTMKDSHYCSVCRRWVSHPYVIDADYYMNERHPSGEKGCEYHEPSFMKEGAAKTPPRPVPGGGIKPAPRPRASTVIWLILFVLFLINFVFPLFFLAI